MINYGKVLFREVGELSIIYLCFMIYWTKIVTIRWYISSGLRKPDNFSSNTEIRDFSLKSRVRCF